MARAEVSETAMVLSLDKKWSAYWAKNDKSDVGNIFSGWRRKLVNRLNEKLSVKANDLSPTEVLKPGNPPLARTAPR